MNRITKISVILAAMLMVTACGIFGKYSPQTTVDENLYGHDAMTSSSMDQPSIGEMSWRDFFTDVNLKNLIDTALCRNTDLVNARMMVEEANASLVSAKLGYLPSLSFSPSLNLTPGNSYSLPLNLQWGTDGFGSITTRKRAANALAIQALDYEKTVQSQLIASVAQIYAQLVLYDKQMEILEMTRSLFEQALDTQKALMENGKAFSTAVNQMQASVIGLDIMKINITNMIHDTEAALCLILHQTPQHVERSKWTDFSIPHEFGTGVPARILANRPDVRAAERALEAAFYVTAQSRAAMIPSISLTGLLGWSNGGTAITDPLSFIYNAAVSLVQPVFAQGKLRANLKINKLRQQEAAEQFAQTVLNAGNEVNVALADCQASCQKEELYKKQVASLKEAFYGTRELMNNGKASYLEVLTAQESYLEACLEEAENSYEVAQSLINLYAALGGGAE